MIRDLFVFRGRTSVRAEVTLGVLSAMLVLILWEIVARAEFVAPQFLPSPTRVLAALWTMATDQHLLWHAGISTLRVWVAFLIAAAMAIPIGILMSSYRVVGASLEPTIDFIRYLPARAGALSIIWFGVGEETKIFLLWLGRSFNSYYWSRMICGACPMSMSRLPSHLCETTPGID